MQASSSDSSAPLNPSAELASLDAAGDRRADLVALLIVLIAALVVYQRLTLHPADLLVGSQHQGRNDLTSAFLAFQSYPGQLAARTGELPWWNPGSLGGAPHFGNPQSALLYPPNWLARWFDPFRWMSWMLVVHHLWGGIGAYFLARRWGFERIAATFAGVCVVGAPYFVAQTGEGHYNQICVTAWIPWTWLAWEWLAAGRRTGVAACTVTLAMAFFAGHVQEWYYLLWLLLAVTTAECIGRWRRKDRRSAVRLARDTVLAMALAIGVVAVELVPVYLYTTQTVRSGVISAAEAGEISLGVASVRQLLDPLAWGGPDAYRGPGRFYWETLFHFGVTPLVLAALALVVGRDDRRVVRLACLAFLAIAFAFGDGSPVFSAAHRLIPGVGMFRSPSRVLFFVSLFLPLLAAAALDDARRRRLACVGPRRTFPYGGRTASMAALVLLFGVVLYEETRHANSILRTVRGDSRRPSRLWLDVAPGIQPGDRVLAEQSLLSDREAWELQLTKLQGYEPVPLVRQVALADALQQGGDPGPLLLGFQPIDLSKLNAKAASAAGLRWAIVSPQSGEVPENWRLEARGSAPDEYTQRGLAPRTIPYEVYENVDATPRAFAVGRAIEASGREAVRTLGDIDGRREVILPMDVLSELDEQPRTTFRPAEVVETRANRLVVDITLDAPGYLVVQDTWAPGWKARADGASATILPANVAARAVALDAGSHRVEFDYSPPGLGVGLFTSCASLLLVAVWTWRQRSVRS